MAGPEIEVQLRADTAAFIAGVKAAQGALQQAARRMDGASRQIDRTVQRSFGQIADMQSRIAALFRGGGKSAADSAAVFEEEAQRQVRAVAGLEAQLDPAVRALREYEAAQQLVARAVATGAISQERANGILALAGQRYQASSAALDQAATGAGRALRISQGFATSFGTKIQQAGYQVQDFAVQVAAGTSPMIAFTQQGSQLLGVFAGPWGAVLGAAVGITGALAVGLLGAGEEAATLDDRLDDLAGAIRAYRDAAGDAASPLADLQEELGGSERAITDLIRALELAARRDLQQQLDATIRTLKDSDFVESLGSAAARIRQLRSDTDDAVRPMEQLTDQQRKVIELSDALEDLYEAEGAEQIADALQLVRNLLEQVGRSDLSGIIGELARVEQSARDVADAFRDAADARAVGFGDSPTGEFGTTKPLQGVRPERTDSANQSTLGTPRPQRGGGRREKTEEERLLALTEAGEGRLRQMERELALIGKTEAEQRRLNAAFERQAFIEGLADAARRAGIDGAEEALAVQSALTAIYDEQAAALLAAADAAEAKREADEAAEEAAKEAARQNTELADTIAEISGEFISAAGSTEGFGEAIGKLGLRIAELAVRGALLGDGPLGGLFDGLFGATGGLAGLLLSAKGNVFSGGRVVPFAKGGVVGQPTFFPMRGGTTGLMGENGPEAIMPLARDSAGRLGVRGGGGGTSVVINQHNDFRGQDPTDERRLRRLADQIKQESVAAAVVAVGDRHARVPSYLGPRR